MASAVEICNMALMVLGDDGNVATIDPPEATTQSKLSARFFPQALSMLLGARAWSFAIKRVALSVVDATHDAWDFVYAVPNDSQLIRSVHAPGEAVRNVPFAVEVLNAQQVVLTDQEQAYALYVTKTIDPTLLPPLAVQALVHQLASMLAGPVVKGEEGRAESKQQLSLAERMIKEASEKDAQQWSLTANPLDFVPEHIAARY